MVPRAAMPAAFAPLFFLFILLKFAPMEQISPPKGTGVLD